MCEGQNKTLCNLIASLASLAQSVERVAVNHKVIGSNPVGSAIVIFHFYYFQTK
jgi:hypothetical protein